MDKLELQKVANEVRKGHRNSSPCCKGRPSGRIFSAADVFTYLYFEEMNIDPKDPKKQTVTVCPFQRTHSTRTLLCTCRERIFSQKRI